MSVSSSTQRPPLQLASFLLTTSPTVALQTGTMLQGLVWKRLQTLPGKEMLHLLFSSRARSPHLGKATWQDVSRVTWL